MNPLSNRRKKDNPDPDNINRSGRPVFQPFAFIWICTIIILMLVGCWMIFNKESSYGTVGGSRYHTAGDKPASINGYSVLCYAIMLLLIFAFFSRGVKKRNKQ